MNFLALLLGLAIERGLTHLFHLREFRWLDPLFDRFFRHASTRHRFLTFAGLVLSVLLLVAPVAVAAGLLWDEFLQIPFFLFSVLVLLFSLGPRDLDDEVDEYCQALEADDQAKLQHVARELLEREPPAVAAARNEAVERAIYVQANNRIFGVIFWFLVLGPAGAWLFRVVDLMRRRMEHQRSQPEPGPAAAVSEVLRQLHALVGWIPSRLLLVAYGLAGNFEAALTHWRESRGAELSLADSNAMIMARVGLAATGREAADIGMPGDALVRIRAARGIVMRCLWMIWCPVVALMTLYDWLS